MPLVTDDHKIEDFLGYIESLNPSDLPNMLATRVLPSFVNTLHKHGINSFSQSALTYWTIEMMNNAMKPSTVQRYLGALNTLYKEWKSKDDNKLLPEEPVLDFSIPTVPEYDDEAIESLKQTLTNLNHVSDLTKINKKPLSKEYTYLNALIYLLINPEASLADVVDLKFSDPQPSSFHIEDIKLAMRNIPQAQYVFALEQGKRRKQAIIHDLVREMRSVSHLAGLQFGNSFSRDSITALWIASAIREEVTFHEIRALVKQLPKEFSFFSILPHSPISEERKVEILNKVASSFINNSTGWYVMRLRSGVTPDIIKEELQFRKFPLLRQVEFYAPSRTRSKIIKKKTVKIEVPILPGILFFRMRYDKISKMMSMIGDLAWCYRTTNNPSSPYSAIPQSEMKTFQRCVGSLTADIEMEIISSQPALKVGDEVIVENGSALAGQEGVIRKVRNKDGSLTYTLRLSDSEYIHWNEVTLSAAYVTPKKVTE